MKKKKKQNNECEEKLKQKVNDRYKRSCVLYYELWFKFQRLCVYKIHICTKRAMKKKKCEAYTPSDAVTSWSAQNNRYCNSYIIYRRKRYTSIYFISF